ncbi:heterokaryon incompatibility protein-domain-containing protein [Leptodontidium sp. MPI-SDFR-AT-0119]|nr:heterokaryon incompatibility protein-domain-containing protein [Leptodontidium sp. MPI-SDFR-AT-0119]
MSSSKNTAASTASSSQSGGFQHEPLTEPESEIRLLRILPLIRQSNGTESSRSQKQHGTTTKVLTNIRRLVRNSYRKHINSTVHCEIFHVNLDQAPSYKALSYTWGSPDDPQLPIKLNRQTFFVRENLWLALQQLHAQSDPVVIWIDAVCINQTDDMERNEQVTKMKTIYEKAEEVVVWLGPSYEDSHLAFQLIQEMYDHRHDVEWIARRFQQPELKRPVVALHNLHNRDYWWRMWIVQELTVAKCISLQCGADSIGAVALDETQKLLRAMARLEMGFQADHLLNFLPNNSVARDWVQSRGLYEIRTFQQAFDSQDLSFTQSLLYNWTRESSDPKDMVYGLAALANSTSKYQIEIDYSLSVAEVYIDLAKKEIQNCKTLEILTRARSGSTLVGLPSWVPDWSRTWDSHFFLNDITEPQLAFSASGESTRDVAVSDDDDILFLKGVVIGMVEIISAHHGMTNEQDLDNARLVFLKWWNLLGKSGDRRNLTQEKFGRTLICDRSTEHSRGDWDRDEFCRSIVGKFGALCCEILPSEDIDSELAAVHSWMVQRSKELDGDVFVRDSMKKVNRTWIQSSWLFLWDRRFLLGSSNIMGLAPQGVKEGDIICVPLGCPHPMIFRKVDGHHIVIGEAYVDGYMRGKAMDMLDQGELELETFELH